MDALIGFLGGGYLWVKAIHLIFVIFWMAGLFMMPRFFAYHMECAAGSAEEQIWVEREARLQRIILNPAMVVAWLMGILLVLNIGFTAGGWLHAKLLMVLFLSGFHGVLSKTRKELARGERSRSSKFYRLVNEVPSIFIILIVIFVVVRPF